ncbi:hypothetical protein F2Q68_00001280 [Brassica cretica]|uniref:Uncharacterized protein n=1 Tax=Brassica cretica TaxID=69181 RepID=A0A8S9JEF3_BRACR|nr:hypothetical protein F2Q68_00001280 [Brassica cretica]
MARYCFAVKTAKDSGTCHGVLKLKVITSKAAVAGGLSPVADEDGGRSWAIWFNFSN